MSVVRGFGLNGQHYYSNIAKPTNVECNFIVDNSNGNGLGIRSLKSNGYIESVFMHTTATPGVVNGFTNPNPAVGYALIHFKNNFNYFVGMCGGFVSAVSGSALKVDNTALTIGNPYIITTLGNATSAQWTTLGVPSGVTPAVGVSFIALATTAGTSNTSTSRVMAPVTAGITQIEIVGNANLSKPSNVATQHGQWVMIMFTNAGTPTAPAAGSVVGLSFMFDGSSVTIDGI